MTPALAPWQPLVLIPSYNTGSARLLETVRGALESGTPVCVVIDGSTDGSAEAIAAEAAPQRQLHVVQLPRNRGKGAAVEAGARWALDRGHTHALTLDADGQHPTAAIPAMLEAARTHPGGWVMGRPQFGPEAPKARLWGRQLTIAWTDLETLWGGLGDTLFGMRVYPLWALLRALRQTPCARGYDFDPEVAVRLYWAGLRPLQHPVPCHYFSREEGGVSHFHYLRDNVKLTLLHVRLVPEWLLWRLWRMPLERRRALQRATARGRPSPL